MTTIDLSAITKQFTYEGFTTEYFDLNQPTQPDAPVLVLLHSIRASKEIFAGVVPHLADHFRILGLDLRGHGNTSRQKPYSFRQIADDIRRLLEHEKVEKATVVGASFSCVPAQMFAVTYPKLTDKIVLLDGGYFRLSDVPGFHLEGAIEHFQSVSYASMADAQEFFQGRYGAYHVDFPVIEHELEQKEDGSYSYRLPVDAFRAYFNEYATFDVDKLFAKLEVPVLLMLADETKIPGDEEREFFLEARQAYLKTVETAEAVRLEDSLHLLMLTHPKETAERISEFVLK
ncbi:alpha/beta fold hydrolase [Brevibacillus dissolubilis]|uniref:alpha/beta fold hydrolase n=1 Tax=Brevibacillus dissolubilis TaxID=1844116 RepID=UPI00111701C5|nr:alpha/beta hydrolase [Brevibacillus dissolubilis]